MHLFLGLDIGTTSISLVVIDLSSGNTQISESRPHKSHITCGEPDAYILDSDKVISIARAMVDSAIDRYPAIEGIGITGQMHGVVILDDIGAAITPAYTWLDMRAARIAPYGRSYLEELENRTGIRLAPGYSAATLFALSESGGIPEGSATFCTITDYVAMQFAGLRSPLLDPSQAHSMGLFDIESEAFIADRWESVTSLEIPRVVPSATVIGCYRGGIPITAAVGDNQASFLSSIRDVATGILVNIGTSGQICYLDSSGKQARKSDLDIRPFPSGGRLMVGASLTGGKAFDVLAGLIGDLSELIGAPVDPYSVLDRLRTPPDAQNALRAETTFKGTRLNPEKTGSVSGISLDNFTIDRLFWAFAEGIVGELYGMIEKDHEILERPGIEVVASGNAVEKNPLLKLAIERRFSMSVQEPLHGEAAARGASFIAIAGTQGGVSVLSEITEKAVRYR